MKLDLNDLRAKADFAAVNFDQVEIAIGGGSLGTKRVGAFISAANPKVVLALIDRIEDLEAGVYSAVSDITWAADRHEVPSNILDCLSNLQRLLKPTKLAEIEKAEDEG